MGPDRSDPVAIKLLKTPKKTAAFYDFEEYERLVKASRNDECLLLRTSPALDLSCASKRRLAVRIRFRVSQFDRPALRRVPGGSAFLMLDDAVCKIVGLANREPVIGTAKDVDEVHGTTTMASSGKEGKSRARPKEPFDSLRSLRAFSLAMARHERACRLALGELAGESNGGGGGS